MSQKNHIKRAISHFGAQEKLASEIGVSQATVSQWLIGQRPVTAENALKIEKATRGVVKVSHFHPELKMISRGKS